MIDTLNRVFLSVLGTALGAIGTVLLLARNDVIDLEQPSALYADIRDVVVDNESASLAIVLAGCLLVLLLCLWSLRLQSGLHRPHKVRALSRSTDHGITRLDPDVIEKAIAYELRNQPDIDAARVAVTKTGLNPRFRARVEVMPTIDLASVATSLRVACDTACKNLAVDSLDGEMRITLASRDVPRVD